MDMESDDNLSDHPAECNCGPCEGNRLEVERQARELGIEDFPYTHDNNGNKIEELEE